MVFTIIAMKQGGCPFNSMNDLQERKIGFVSRQLVSSVDSRSRLDHARLHEPGQNLGKIRRGKPLKLCQLLDTDGCSRRESHQIQQSMERIIGRLRILHTSFLSITDSLSP